MTNRYALLRSAGLPFPRSVASSQEPISREPLPAQIYLRQQYGDRLARVVTSAEYLDLLAGGKLRNYKAVEFIPSVAGATTAAAGGKILVEITLGHLSGLLQHGLIATRHLMLPEPSVSETATFKQTTIVDPDSMTLVDASDSTNDFTNICADIASRAYRAFGDAHLTEVMITPEGTPIWVDAKTYPWMVDFAGLFREDRAVIYGNSHHTHEWHPGVWHPAAITASLSGRSLTIGERPLTSHLVTYALNRGLDAIYNR